jgi:hypothetical protein
MKTFDHSIYKVLVNFNWKFILLNMKFDMKMYYFSNMFVLTKSLELVFEKSNQLNIWTWNIIKNKTFDIKNLTKNIMDLLVIVMIDHSMWTDNQIYHHLGTKSYGSLAIIHYSIMFMHTMC